MAVDDPLSNINRSILVNTETEIAPTQSRAPAAQQGISETSDVIETSKLDVFRTAYLSGRSEGRMLMSESSLNHVLRNELTPQQYPDAFRDLKNWVRTNFALTSDQEQTLNLMSEQQVVKVQQAGARAAELNLPLSFEMHDEDPSAAGPRNLAFSDPVTKSDSVTVQQNCQRRNSSMDEDFAQFLQGELKENGIQTSPDDLKNIVNHIASGDAGGMAVALYISSDIAGANNSDSQQPTELATANNDSSNDPASEAFSSNEADDLSARRPAQIITSDKTKS